MPRSGSGPPDMVGLGVSTLDLVMAVDEFPDDERVQRAHESVLQGGGPVATAMVAAARLGTRTAMLDSLGDDWRGRLIREEFRREGVLTDGIEVVAGASSSIASIWVRRVDGARTIAYAPGSADPLTPERVDERLLSSAKVLHVNGRHWAACLHAVRQARARGADVSFDGGAHRFRPELRELIPLTDICIVAREFASAFTGVTEVRGAASALLDAGPRLVVVTSGQGGSWVFGDGEDGFHQPAYTVDAVVDTTGAGDAYHGAFLSGLARGLTLRSCARLGSAVAALSTRALGGRRALPTLDEAEAFIRALDRA